MTTQLFKDETYIKIRDAILAIDPSVTKDIYAISFYKNNVDDDPRHPILTVGYNTIIQWKKSSPNSPKEINEFVASDSIEAKWNYAFWLQNEEIEIGKNPYDPVSNWVRQLPYYYTDQQEIKDPDKTEDLGSKIQKEFINILIDHARKLHEEGVVIKKFGNEIPIIIHELEYSDSTIIWTKKANPPDTVKEFEDWINSIE